jgi:hypothetical protein
MHGVPTKELNKAVKRNPERFPEDFRFRLTAGEVAALRFRLGSSIEMPLPVVNPEPGLRLQIVTSKARKPGRGGRRDLPRAFAEQRVAMLSSVLRSPRAVSVNVEIMRAFVRMRRLLMSHADLAKRLTALEKKYDARFRSVFDAIRALMQEDAAEEKPYTRAKIGCGVEGEERGVNGDSRKQPPHHSKTRSVAAA